ncbi:MAG: S1 RNA-binding domain-containing protein [Lachnospiraceae bacterium]|nr:S1 RNA-binding domain-containing protein [Lachnospiraceae bacterium]
MDDYRTELESSFRKIREGDILTGTVISVNEAGALMDLNYYASGIIPAEEMSDDPHFSILGEVKVGDVLTGVVSKRDDGRGHILLSRREADRELAWGRLRKLMKEKTNITGKVTELTKAGAIMYLEGVRGFIPNSKLGLTYVEDNTPYLNRQLDVRVAEVDEENKRLILSAKEILQEQAIAEKNRRIEALTVGNVVEGTVESLKDYGAFVTIAEGISGLLHISQISNTRVKNIRSVLKEGQPVKVLITKIEGGKISLSMKAVEDMINTEKAEEEPSEYSDGGQATTSLADLLKGLKF